MGCVGGSGQHLMAMITPSRKIKKVERAEVSRVWGRVAFLRYPVLCAWLQENSWALEPQPAQRKARLVPATHLGC